MAKKRKLAKDSNPEPRAPVQEGEQPSATDERVEQHPSDEPESEPIEEESQSQEPIQEENPPLEPKSEPNGAPPSQNCPEEEEEENGEESDPASIQSLLEPLQKDQLVELLRDAAAAHADVLACVRSAADADPAHRKIFVHGLGWDTTAETLRAAFLPYGEIEDCKAVADKATGRSKGYGFVLFKHRSGARRSLEEPQKKIGSRMTACQLASAGPPGPPPTPPVSEYTQRKIYVSNVGAELDPQRLTQFFAKYGEIEEGPLGLDKVTGKPKGFCLFVYKMTGSARKALEEPHKNFEGHVLHCQKAIDGPKPNKSGFGLQHGGASHPGGAGVHGGPHFPRNDNAAGLLGGAGNHSAGHLMAPAAAGLGLNQATQQAAAVAAGLNPVLGQALTALLATQGGLGLTNLLGAAGISGSGVNQAVQNAVANSGGQGLQGVYGNQVGGVGGNANAGVMGGFGASGQMPGGYGNVPMGQGSGGRPPQGMGNLGGMAPYMGH